MKTFEQIVDACFKPEKPDGTKRDIFHNIRLLSSKEMLYELETYSSYISKPFYGADINEPVVTICKRILTKPERFSLVCVKHDEYVHIPEKLVVVCRDTGQRFVVIWDKITNLSFLTDDENKLLYEVFHEWYEAMKVVEHEKKIKREQRRKDKFRQELTDLYKDL